MQSARPSTKADIGITRTANVYVRLRVLFSGSFELIQERFYREIVKSRIAKSFAVIVLFSFAIAAFGLTQIGLAQKRAKASAAGQAPSLLSSLAAV